MRAPGTEADGRRVIVSGSGASQGIVEGTARVVEHGVGQRLGHGEILVARITDATMMADIIINASAIVTDLGGIASHPAIVARELGIPCVVATGNATELIKDGQVILVDGSTGTVYG